MNERTPTRQPRKRRARLVYVVEDVTPTPEDPEVAAAVIAAWLDSLGDKRKK